MIQISYFSCKIWFRVLILCYRIRCTRYKIDSCTNCRTSRLYRSWMLTCFRTIIGSTWRMRVARWISRLLFERAILKDSMIRRQRGQGSHLRRQVGVQLVLYQMRRVIDLSIVKVGVQNHYNSLQRKSAKERTSLFYSKIKQQQEKSLATRMTTYSQLSTAKQEMQTLKISRKAFSTNTSRAARSNKKNIETASRIS